MKTRVAPLLAQFKEGYYNAVVESIELKDGSYGEYLKWSFMVPTPKGEAVSVNGLTSTIFSQHERCKFYHWACAILGKPLQVHDELDTDTLINQKCRVRLIVQELETGGSVNRVDKVLPVEDDEDDNPFA
jgi:hypothetical protein